MRGQTTVISAPSRVTQWGKCHISSQSVTGQSASINSAPCLCLALCWVLWGEAKGREDVASVLRDLPVMGTHEHLCLERTLVRTLVSWPHVSMWKDLIQGNTSCLIFPLGSLIISGEAICLIDEFDRSKR